MEKRETGRWLKALEIAGYLFEDEGYSSSYLEEIKDFILTSREGLSEPERKGDGHAS
ncbi:MAG: hypothetical protein DDT29_02442 [Dehalococcoidia bacterium]|nr:hypothetical protein [Bacillota bacterium]